MAGFSNKALALVWLGWSLPGWAQDAVSEPPVLSGTFHLRMRTSTHAKVPVLGTTVIDTTTQLLARIVQTETGWVQHHHTCAVHTKTSRAIAKTVLPDRFIQSLSDKRYTLVIAPDDQGWSLTADLLPQHIGYDPVASGGVMPTDKKDPSIIDWDLDGKPGATVLLQIPIIGEVGIYMVQYNHSRIEGRVESNDRITGTLSMQGMNQRTIGADNRLFIANPSLKPAPNPQPFEMVRIADGSTCSDLPAGTAPL